MDWKVWYDDGGAVSSEDCSVPDVPTRGVQAIAYPDLATGYRVLSQHDYYWWEHDAGQWFGGDTFGLWDYLAQPGWKKVLFGRSMTDEEYEALLRRASNDSELPEKSAFDSSEWNLRNVDFENDPASDS